MESVKYTCGLEAEPLYRYKPGGYHPILLGDVLEDRYVILHKLGWGGYATVWAARDRRDEKNVALKVAIADEQTRQETYMLERLNTSSAVEHSEYEHLPQLLDHFDIEGPNGQHRCTVLNIVGNNVGDLVSGYLKNTRLSAKLAKSFTRQSLLALDTLHSLGIAHGDVHVRNLALSTPGLAPLTEEELMSRLGSPKLGPVSRKDNEPIPAGIPKYLVKPTTFAIDLGQPSLQVQLIDFGEAFTQAEPPRKLNTPLVVRPPEAIFEDKLDLRVDIWSMGCMIFELITGQPPFNSIMVTKSSLLIEMLELTGEQLPQRWQSAYHAILADANESAAELEYMTLQQWLHDVYFDEDKKAELSPEELTAAGELITSMLRLEPRDRISIKEALKHPWLNDEPER